MDLSSFRNMGGAPAFNSGEEGPKNIEEFLNSKDFKRLKEDYGEVFEQIKERSHLVRGYVTYNFDLPSIGEVILRTLTVKERNFISLAVTPNIKNPTASDIARAQILEDKLTMMFCVEKLGDLTGDDDWHIAPPEDMDYEKWMDDPTINEKSEEIDKLGGYIEETIMLIIRQMIFAVNMAMADQLKNLNTLSKQ